MALETIWFDEIDSTQSFLLHHIKHNTLKPPVLVGATKQTNGKGRRGDSWSFFDGALAISFAIPIYLLPKNMPLSSSAIFAGYVLKALLTSFGSMCWMKWPNDLYIDDKKLAGIIAMPVGDVIVFGAGLNAANTIPQFAKSDVIFEQKTLANSYMSALLDDYAWDSLFMQIEVEFDNNLNRLRKIYSFSENTHISICKDGALIIDGRKVYTLT